MGPLALAVADRATRRRRVSPESHDWKSGIAADVRHAFRAIRLNRGFSAVVILTLAVGIGSCTAVFSIVNALLLGSLPYPNPEQLALVRETDATIARRASSCRIPTTKTGGGKRGVSRNGHLGVPDLQRRIGAEPEQVQGIRASASLFTVLGVRRRSAACSAKRKKRPAITSS